MTTRSLYLLILIHSICFLWLSGTTWSQETPLTSGAEIKALGSTAAEQERKPVRFRAFHLSTSAGAVISHLQQDGESIVALFRNASEVPPPNTLVEIIGVTRGSQHKQFPNAPWVEVTSVQVLERDTSPPPIIASVEEVVKCRHPLKWVEVDGRVLLVKRVQNDLLVIMIGESGWMLCVIRDTGPTQELPMGWMNARLRVRGMNLAKLDDIGISLITSGLANITIVEPGYADGFDAPPGEAAALLKAATGSAQRVKLTASVMHFNDANRVWLRDAAGTAFIARFILPWAPDPNAPHLTAPTHPHPTMHQGDVVEIVGSPLADPNGLFLRECEARVVRHAPLGEPKAINGADLKQRLQRNEYVSFKGRYVSQNNTKSSVGNYFESVHLNCEGTEVEVFLETKDGGHLPVFSTDDLMEATGLVTTESVTAPCRLLLRSATDLRIHGTAPEVARSQQLRNIAIVIGSTLLALGFFLYFRRRLQKERAHANQIQLLNADLEHRVSKRTEELEQARVALAEALKAEQAVGELKSRFVTSVSHEFRTPLGVIMSATDLLSRYRERLPTEQVDEHLQEIRHATRQMSNMMEDILLLGRAEAGRVDIHPLPMDLLELCQRLADETRSAAAQSGQTVITCDPLPGPARIDEMLFRHIFNNLLHNAIKYSPEEACIKVHLRAEGTKAIISIADEGIGIPAEDQDKLFEPFSRADNVGHLPGTGLGLVVVKRCAELHGGSISFTSIPGQGTTFLITLPVWE
jgi:signal transduction histidine kinase